MEYSLLLTKGRYSHSVKLLSTEEIKMENNVVYLYNPCFLYTLHVLKSCIREPEIQLVILSPQNYQ